MLLKRRLLLFPPLLAGALGAQTAVQRTLMDREGEGAPPATLWVVDAKGGRALAEGFSSLLGASALKVYQVPMKALALDGAKAREALASHGLPAAPQWYLADARTGALRARGTALPPPEAFARTLQEAGFRDRAQDLQAYLKRNPDSLEAREQLMAVLRQRGEAAAQRFMGIQVDARRERLEGGDLAGASAPEGSPKTDLSQAKPMGAVQDLEAWSAFAQELDTVFRSGQWREMDMAWTREGRPLDAASLTLQGLYLRWMPAVEEALRQDPSSESSWSLWCRMSEASGGRRLRPLLDSLRPSPLTPKSEWPPESVIPLLFASAKTPGDWQALKAHYQAVWEDGSHPLLQRSVEQTASSRESDWSGCLGPLIECCLRAGDATQADALFRGAMEASRWGSLAEKAAALAARCGQPALAARWKAAR
ncbi:MAG TPA: hypothetical protein VL181_06045 [Holophagaceae bacterium]|nr:hypothetical protein [Holophagaceae bacterium]